MSRRRVETFNAGRAAALQQRLILCEEAELQGSKRGLHLSEVLHQPEGDRLRDAGPTDHVTSIKAQTGPSKLNLQQIFGVLTTLWARATPGS